MTKFYFVFLGLILTIFVSSFLYYLNLNQTYITGDQHQYVGIAVNYLKILHNPNTKIIEMLMDASAHRPPLYPLLLAFSYQIFGLSNPTLYGGAVNAFFLMILGYSIWGISYYYFKNNLISLISVVIGLSYPLLILLSYQVMTELSLTALVSLVILLLLKSDYFENKKYLNLSAIIFGFALLTRFTAGFYLLIPLIYFFYAYFKKNKFNNLKLFIIPFILGIAIPAFYYLHNLQPFLKYVFANTSYGPSWSPHDKLSIESILWYPLILGESLSIYLFLIFCFGLIIGVFNFRKYVVLYLWLLSTYIIFTFLIPFKTDRFIVPVYPALAVISVIPLYKIIHKKYFIIVSLTFGFIAFMVFVYTSWGKGPINDFPIIKKEFFKDKIIYNSRSYSKTPVIYFYSADKIIRALEKDVEENKINNPSILFTFSIEDINKVIYEYIYYKNLNNWKYNFLVDQDQKYYLEKLKTSNYILAKEGETVDSFHPAERVKLIPSINKEFLKYVKDNSDYILIEVDNFKDGSKIYLYKKVN